MSIREKMKKGNKSDNKGLVVFTTGIVAASLTGCGGGGGDKPNTAPKIEGVSSQSMYEETGRIISDIICSDPDGDKVIMTVSSGNSNLIPNYNEITHQLALDATTMSLADGVNEDVDITLSCTDGKLETNATMKVTVQDAENDPYYSINSIKLPTSITEGQDYNITIKGHDEDGLPTSISYEVKDLSDNSIADNGAMDCKLDPGSNTDSTCISSISGLAVGNYNVSCIIMPNKVGENPQPILEKNQDFEVVAEPTFSLSGPSEGTDSGEYKITLDLDGVDLNDLTFRLRASYDENGDGQDYDYDINPGDSIREGMWKLDSNGNFTLDTTITGYGDNTSMGVGDWVEIEVTNTNAGKIKAHKFIVK